MIELVKGRTPFGFGGAVLISPRRRAEVSTSWLVPPMRGVLP